MSRDFRFRLAGLLFYFFLAINLVCSKIGQDFLQKIIFQNTELQIFQAMTGIIGVGAIIFTSDIIGYLISTIYYFFWNNILIIFKKGKIGYEAEMENLSYNLKDYIIGQYTKAQDNNNYDLHKKFNKKWGNYSADVFLSYFFQQAPLGIVNWASRRHSAFFAGMSSFISLVIAIMISVILINAWSIGWTIVNTILNIILLIIAIILYRNANFARKEARQIIDLWIAQILNPKLKEIMDELQNKI